MTSDSVASSSRQLAGLRPDCASARTASAPAAKESKATPAESLCSGRSWTRTQASVITPRMPSEPISIRSGLGPAPEPGQPPALPRPRRRDRAHRLDQVVDVGPDVAKCPPARVAIQPPSVEYSNDCGKWRSVSPCSASCSLSGWPEHARLNPRRARHRVHLQHPVERAEVDRHRAGVAVADPRLDPADDARPAAVGDRRRARVRAPLEHRLDLGLVAGARDQVGRVVEPARESRGRHRCRPCRARARPVRACRR